MIKNSQGIFVPESIIKIIFKNESYLSELDSLGDGDHGVNMAKGMKIAQKDIIENKITDMSGGFKSIMVALMDYIGGSLGPLYGMLFRGFIETLKNQENIDGRIVDYMLQNGLNNVETITAARIGDKTMLDTLIPAVNSYKKEWKKTTDLSLSLNAMQKAAKMGFESTRSLKAKVGRASRLGNETVGHLDAGAGSCYLILKAFAQSMIKLERGE